MLRIAIAALWTLPAVTALVQSNLLAWDNVPMHPTTEALPAISVFRRDIARSDALGHGLRALHRRGKQEKKKKLNRLQAETAGQTEELPNLRMQRDQLLPQGGESTLSTVPHEAGTSRQQLPEARPGSRAGVASASSASTDSLEREATADLQSLSLRPEHLHTGRHINLEGTSARPHTDAT